MSSSASLHDRAKAALARNGVPVTFTLTGQGTYNPATDATTSAPDVIITGAAFQDEGDLDRYQVLGLIASRARRLFFVPDTLDQVPPLGSIVAWGGASFSVKDVDPLAPTGQAIAATVVVAL